MHTFFRLVGIGLVCWLGVACGSDPTPTPTPTATSAPPTVAPTATPLPPTAILTPTVATTGTVAAAAGVTATAVLTTTQCSVEADLDLAGYPDLEQKLGCALATATFERVGINEFGEGPDFDRFMLWFEAEQQIYVLRPEGRWQAYADTWTEDQPTYPCNPMGGEATSPPLPRRGFGKLWCSDPTVQREMGTIGREERACQHSVTQRFALGRLVACYEDATIRYLRLLDDGHWDTVLAQ